MLSIHFTLLRGEIVLMLLQNDTFSPGLPDILTATGNFVSASSDIQIYQSNLHLSDYQNHSLGVFQLKLNLKKKKIKCLDYYIYVIQ